jgi:hypothetical protein
MFSILFAPRRKTIKSERGVRVSNIGYQSINIEGRTTTYFDGGTKRTPRSQMSSVAGVATIHAQCASITAPFC